MEKQRISKKDLIGLIAEQLDLNDYKPISVGAGAFTLEKKETNGNVKRIFLPYNVYPGSFYLNEAISGNFSLFKVESILEKYYKKYNLNYLLITIHNSSRRHDLSSIELTEKLDIDRLFPYLKEMIIEDILPFFERYQTVEQVYEQMEAMPVMKMSEFIFNPMPIRRTILKALVKEKGWEEYAMGLLEYTRNKALKNPRSDYSNEIKYLPELIEGLKQMQK